MTPRFRLPALLARGVPELVEAPDILALAPVALATVYAGELSPAGLRQMGRRTLLDLVQCRRDNNAVLRGAGPARVFGSGHVAPLAAAGRGAVVAAAHLGPFHHVASELSRIVPRLCVFSAPHVMAPRAADWERVGAERGCRLEMLSSGGRTSLVRALRALRDGAVVLIYADVENRVGRGGGGHAVDIEFLSLPVTVRPGPVYLAARAGVPMLRAASWRERGRIRVAFSAPVDPPPPGDPEAMRAEILSLYAWFEEHIRRHPTQWDGWLRQLLLWRETGSLPAVDAGVWKRAVASARESLGDRRRRIVVEPAHVGWVRRGEEILILDGPRRLVLRGTPEAMALLEAGVGRTRLADLPRKTGRDPALLARDLARVTLAGLARIEPNGDVPSV